MPIRMVNDDPNQDPRDDENSNDNLNDGGNSGRREAGGGGLGNIFMFLPMIFGLFKQFPKFTMFVLMIGAFMYFKGCGMMSGGGGNDSISTDGGPGRGAEFKKEEYDKADVFEPLDSDPRKTPLPDQVSLLRFAPKRLNQGQQGSCVGWGSAYAARTIIESASTGQNPDQLSFSPAFLYNQIGLQGCQGSYINKAMEYMQKQGSLPFREFPYDDRDCGTQPDRDQVQRASTYRMRGYTRLTEDAGDYNVNFGAIKQNLAAGAPVVFGMNVTKSFTNEMMGRKMWQPSQQDYAGMNSLGGHCMTLIGYDDNIQAFQVMNSWGSEWGENGIGWVKYKDFLHFTQEAYGIAPMAKKDGSENTLACNIGLIDVSSKRYIPLTTGVGNLFKTISPIAKGTKFKMEVKNSAECYIYIFGQETDNSSYVLFPYTKKHSPFCAITGIRTFPRKESLQADAVGNKDFMAIVVTKQAIDFNRMNQAINSSRAATYQGKVNEACAQMAIQGVRFASQGGVIQFSSQANTNQGVAMVVEIDKQ